MSTDLLALTLADARDKLRNGDIGAVELTDAYIDALEKLRPLNAFITDTLASA